MTPELLNKLESARALLSIKGFLTDVEDKKVGERIKKACEKSGLQVTKKTLVIEGPKTVKKASHSKE